MCKISLRYEFVSSRELVDNNCKCSVKHIPKPLQLATISVEGEKLFLCPSGLFNLVDLLRLHDLTGGLPAGSLTKHYGKYIRDLANQINHS